MKTVKNLIASGVVAGAVALAANGIAAQDAHAADKEKCYGVAKAGKNDCGDAKGRHSCVGQSTVDGDGSEWVALPKGVCEKLVGGSLEPYDGMKKDDDMMQKDG
mgnify:FL=1